ncbi:long-chain-fatty-acid--CoA ligase [Yinghuangia seranimata]|uniref:long-chain-fatty-acid--CoA ligase n=1 Tax=Yinghuangia seranimata TaxID=408067 RepID=UPI00248B9883|nr:long-chain-fatty-acid--CoA ligase [Yinghuangia seranimata]MDI2130935.1 long-chain-fatty-acid--CoA ligase [Yinghuangia seranimata]
MSRFIDTVVGNAAEKATGLTLGEPHEPVRLTWGEIHRQARGMAAELVAGGLRPGDSVAVLAAELRQIVPAAQAVWLAGGSVTMLHEPGRRTSPEIWHASTFESLRTVAADLVLLGRPYEDLTAVLTAGGVASRSIAGLEVGDGADDFQVVETGEADVALLQLTSGSTAEPKAVRVTHGNLFANLTDLCVNAEFGSGGPNGEPDVLVSWVPMFHDMGMVGCLCGSMFAGIEMVAVTPTEFLMYPGIWPGLLSKHRGTITAAPNFAYALMARQLSAAEDGAYDLHRVRLMGNGGEPTDPDAMHALASAGARFGLPPEAVNCVYGAAENCVLITIGDLRAPMEVDVVDATALERDRRAVPAKPGADRADVRRYPLLGRTLDHVQVRVVDDKGQVLGDRAIGTLQLRGPSVAAAYATADGVVPAQDEDGWLDMGDEGYLVDGQIVVCGRRKDVIIMGGRNIFPTDIERSAGAVDGVRTGNAIAVRVAADGVGGIAQESFALLVESRGHGDAAVEDAIRDAVSARVLADIGVRPARVVVMAPNSLPKTPSGKLRRSAARDLL